MRIVVTGAGGFLGWHTRLRLHALTEHTVIPITRDNAQDLASAIHNADAIIHLAGINRGPDEVVEHGNIALAEAVATAVTARPRGAAPIRIAYANSIQAGAQSPYGQGKAASREVLAALTRSNSAELVDVLLPNIFGEHARPHYNSFVATFVDAAIRGENPRIGDASVSLLHAQSAAQSLLDGLTSGVTNGSATVTPLGFSYHIQEIWDLLTEFRGSYDAGGFPDLSTKLRVNLFNTYRAALFPKTTPLALTPHSDHRGTFVETVRCRGGEGQTSFSTTVPGVTRGDHYHLEKVERFAVIRGKAKISLRKMFTDQEISFELEGDQPAAVDMPIGWTHNITNTGDDVLLTQFWSHEIFKPEAPDTFPERVGSQHINGSPPGGMDQ